MLRFLCFCLAILPLLGACQLARMQVSPALATVEPFTVDRVLWRVRKPNDPLSFGSWRTTRIDVGWSESRSRQVPVTVSGKSMLDFQSYLRPYRLEVATSNGVPYGATCQSDAQCGGGKDSCCSGGTCSAAGWCSPLCTDDRDCPTGFLCINENGRRCFFGCTDDRNCPTDFLCREKDQKKGCFFEK
jgi:hypothetical protein